MKFDCTQCSKSVDSKWKRKFCSDECKHVHWYANNYDRKKASCDKYRKAHPDQAKQIKLKRHYGMTLEQYRQMSLIQFGVCKICGNKCKTGRDLSVDHCHKTGKIRGLLCHNCNSMLGSANDKVEVLERGIRYLKENEGAH